ncbi:hypothetical protein YC2023_067275 [Brassica napus]
MVVKIPPAVESSWKDVSGGGCGFAMATSESGKLITCGSTDDLGQIYVTSGKHCETPEPFPLPPEVCVQKAEAGWDHCVAVTESHEVYTWGWKECIPTGRVFGQVEGDSCEMNTSFSAEQEVSTQVLIFHQCIISDIRLEPTPIPTFDGQVGNDNSGNDMPGSGAVKKLTPLMV